MEKKKATISFGKIAARDDSRINEVTVNIELRQDKHGPVFSASCDVWNSMRTDYVICGQCFDTVDDQIKYKRNLWDEIVELWRKHHLNDLHSGTPEQEDILVEKFGDDKQTFKIEKEYLKSVGKYETEWKGETLRYGETFVYWDIPEKDLKRIEKIIDDYSR